MFGIGGIRVLVAGAWLLALVGSALPMDKIAAPSAAKNAIQPLPAAARIGTLPTRS